MSEPITTAIPRLNPAANSKLDVPIEAQLVSMTDRARHVLNVLVCECKTCRGTLKHAEMCHVHLAMEYFMEIGKIPKLLADRLAK